MNQLLSVGVRRSIRPWDRAMTRIAAGIIIAGAAGSAAATTGKELKAAYDQLRRPNFVENSARFVSGFTLRQHDFELQLDPGSFWLLDPVTLGGEKVYACAYYRGSGRLTFKPTPGMEQGQLRRFCGDESLVCPIEDAVLYFGPETYRTIAAALTDRSADRQSQGGSRFRKLHRNVSDDTYLDHIADLLRDLANPDGEPMLMVSTELKQLNSGYVLFKYDPNEREEVQFFKKYEAIVGSFMERVCRYSTLACPDNETINGDNKDEIAVRHYDVDASIGARAEFAARMAMTFEARRPAAQVLAFDLGETITADSITTSTGESVEFARIAFDKITFGSLHVFLDKPLSVGDTTTLTFYCGGKMATMYNFEFLVPVSSDWYPSYGWRQRSTFDMRFRYPKQLVLTAIGKELERKVDGDSALMHSVTEEPIANCTFSVGHFSQFVFKEEKLPPVIVYYSVDLHRKASHDFAEYMIPSGSHMEKQVAGDAIAALQLYSHYFGDYLRSSLTISEIFAGHGLAYAGFVQLSSVTWINTDAWGADRLFRAHEVAHQWWGVDVSPETYHDAWLSEGFAEYSALMYLQAVAGNDQFMDKLNEYRNRIFGVRRPLFGSRDETGSIALGYRNSTTESGGDYDLVIYQKGAYVLHMLRNLLIDLKTMKEDRFFTLLRDWYQNHRNGEVTTDDFRRHCEEEIGVDMGWFFDEWINGVDLPVYKLTYTLDQGAKSNWIAHCHIEQSEVPDDFKMYVPLDLDFGNKQHYYLRVMVDKPVVDFDLPPIDMKPKKIKLNPFNSVLCKTKD